MDDFEKIGILHEALGLLHITDDPIHQYYKIGDVLGSGKYGLVRKGISLRNSELIVAIKTINLKSVSSRYHILAQEILTMKRIDHPNIVKVLEIYKDTHKLHIVMEYVEGTELFDFIFKRNKLKESEASSIVKQIVQ
jgi:calcium-dependent protein kinase